MEIEDKNFSPQQSLLLIETMINKTKADISENPFHFLLWGWLIFIGCTGQYLLKIVFHYHYHYAIWLITLVGVVIGIWSGKKQDKKTRVRTFIGDSMVYLWTGMSVTFGISSVMFISVEGGWFYCYPVFILLYGLGTFVSGKILQFRPLVVGGIFNWMIALVAVHFSFDTQMLLAALAILTSYIIPGHLLKAQKG